MVIYPHMVIYTYRNQFLVVNKAVEELEIRLICTEAVQVCCYIHISSIIQLLTYGCQLSSWSV